MGASSGQQVDHVGKLVKKTGQPFTRLSFPKMGHNLHDQDPELFARTLVDWEKTLLTEEEAKRKGVLGEGF
jgi:hypothetical protein